MKRLPLYIVLVLILVTGSFFATTHVAEAQVASAAAGIITKFFGYSDLWEFVAKLVNAFMFIFLAIASWFVALTGSLLNVSINLTLNIKSFVESTTAIYDIWKVIRDISGMFIIFFLLYAAIQLILGVQKPNFGKLIKDIVIAGILINFSFFITGFLIDISNMTSLVLYRAIVPGQPDIGKMIEGGSGMAEATVAQITKSLFNDGGISAVFMQSLALQTQFDPKHVKTSESGDAATVFKVILLNWTSILIMIVVGLSFLAASIAFIVRLVILLVLLAFSPIWFAAAIVPNLKNYAGQWWSMLMSQLTFMPVYLLLMYAGIYILSKSTVFKLGATQTVWQGATAGGAPTDFIAIAVNAVFVVFMLNVPLIAAISMGGTATKWIEKKGWGAGDIFKKSGSKWASRTVGRAAYGLNESAAMKSFISRAPFAGSAVSKGLGKVGNAGWGVKKGGYEDKLKAQKKAQEDIHKKLGEVDESKYAGLPKEEREAAIKAAKASAAERQQNYRSNLPWKPGGVMAFMVGNRANLQSAQKLNKEADKAAKKKAASDAKDADKALSKELAEINSAMDHHTGIVNTNEEAANKLREKIQASEKNNEMRKAMGLESVTASEEKELARLDSITAEARKTMDGLKEKKRDINSKKDKLREDIEKGKEIEQEERDSNLDKFNKNVEDGKDKKDDDKKEEKK
jgi:hypothetical protein